jgi:uncharacterized protein YkwD
MSNASAQEQEFLELINRMRTSPRAELELLLNSGDPSIDGALRYFETNRDTLRNQWSTLQAVAPLAWASELNDSATAHNLAMIAADLQSHQVPGELGLGARLAQSGYILSNAGENIYTTARSIIYGQAGLAIDWGADDPNTPILEAIDGIQNPAAHRNILLSSLFREVGIAVTAEDNPNTDVGPLVVTQEFGNRKKLNGKAYILGVAFVDQNLDSWYQSGEGINNLQVKITGINGTNYNKTLTVGDAGGYQELVDPGQYQVDFIYRDTVLKTQTTAISATKPENIKLDFSLAAAAAETANSRLDRAVQALAPSTLVKPTTVEVVNPAPIIANVIPAKVAQPVIETAQVVNAPVVNSVTQVPVLAADLVLPMVTLGNRLQDGKSGNNILDFSKDFTRTSTPDLTAKIITINLTGVTAEANYRNNAGIYRVDSADGTIGAFKPGDSGYITAALLRSKELNRGVEFDKNGISPKMIEGGIYAPFVVADATVDQVLNSKNPATAPRVYFNYVAANADGFDHIKHLGANKFGFEDTFGGGDRDYNDLVFQVNAKVG